MSFLLVLLENLHPVPRKEVPDDGKRFVHYNFSILDHHIDHDIQHKVRPEELPAVHLYRTAALSIANYAAEVPLP